jgi:cytochrome c551/c552
MKRIILVLLLVCFGAAVSIAAEQEVNVFESHGCDICHKPEASGGSPSLKEIAQGYQGKEAQLIGFFKGEAEPIVQPTKANMMKSFVEKTKALSDADRKALADYIMSHSK